jgi:hypothetical protein
MTDAWRPWEVCGTFERTPEMQALIASMPPMVRVDRSEWENMPIVDMLRNDSDEAAQ